ncbi:MAG: hypothetical protein ACFFAI_16540 [Promethearchaeota archaeon]
MALQDMVLKGFEQIFQNHTILSISGESGTGKTSLALYLVSKSLVNSKNSCFWIQASEQFPKKRLISMYNNDKETCDYLLNNIYITPSCVIPLYSEQNKLLRKITHQNFLFPPDLRFIVIDNISNHLRFEISKANDIRKRTSMLDNFYDNILCPLIIRCQRENIALILLHEVSFNVKLQKTLPFFHSLYKRIKGVDIYLNNSSISKERVMKIEIGKEIASLNFQLNNNGFSFLKRS